MRKNLDYGLLHAMRAFERVVETGSFTLAAEQMLLTTAQVSRLVSDLEKRLATKLLQRTTRRMRLTSAGAAYIDHCRHILDLVVEAEASASGAAADPAGVVRVSCMASFGKQYVVPSIAGFCSRNPAVTVDYRTSQYLPDLLAEGIDVSVYLTHQLTDSSLVAQRLGTTFSLLCAAPSYLKQFGTPGHPKELDKHACVRLVNASLPSAWELISKRRRFTLNPSGPLIADSPDVLLRALTDGLGIAMLPAFSVVDAIRAGSLCAVLPGWRSVDVGAYALYPTRRFVDAKTRLWLDMLSCDVSSALTADGVFFESLGYV